MIARNCLIDYNISTFAKGIQIARRFIEVAITVNRHFPYWVLRRSILT